MYFNRNERDIMRHKFVSMQIRSGVIIIADTFLRESVISSTTRELHTRNSRLNSRGRLRRGDRKTVRETKTTMTRVTTKE